MHHRRPGSTAPFTEVSIDLTAQELCEPAPAAGGSDSGMIEVTDICEVEPQLRTGSFAANSAATPQDDGDSVEIELSAEQMEALLDDRPDHR